MENKIISEIKNLKKDVKPRPEWVNLSRDILLQKINPENQYQKTKVGLSGYIQLFNQVFRQSLLEPAVIMLLVLGVFMTSSLTINAAFYSMPGDNLYPVKIALEKTHVALTTDDEKKVELKIEFAQKRVAELDKIISEPQTNSETRKKKIEAVVKEFKNNVVAVSDHLNKIKTEDGIKEEDKEKTLRMAVSVSSKTEELAKSVDEKVGGLSEVEKIEVEGIIADVIQSVEDANVSAQELADEVNKSEEETQTVQEEGEQGVVEGAELIEQEDESTTQENPEGDEGQEETVETEDQGTTEPVVE